MTSTANVPQSRDELLAKCAGYDKKYRSACSNLLAVVVFTVINTVLLLAKSSSYFLFSAAVPRLLVDLGMYLCGKYPADYYEGNISDYAFYGNGLFAVLVGIAALSIALYLLCWFMAKKRKVGWLIVALVFFAIDTIVFFWWYGFSADMILDLLFHIWVAYYLVMGIMGHFKLKKLLPQIPPAEPQNVSEAPVEAPMEAAVEVAATEETFGEVLKETNSETQE